MYTFCNVFHHALPNVCIRAHVHIHVLNVWTTTELIKNTTNLMDACVHTIINRLGYIVTADTAHTGIHAYTSIHLALQGVLQYGGMYVCVSFCIN